MMQQMGNMQRGNPMIEMLLGQLLGGVKPQMGSGMALPQQIGMGGFGGMAKMSSNWGTNPVKQMKSKSNYKQFLQTHSMYGKKVGSTVDTSRLLKF